MGKVYDTTNSTLSYNLVSQTPKNFKKDNYYLHSMQDKIDYDWEYRPNRVDVEQETGKGEESYFPMEVVIQTVHGDKGTKISDDVRRLVFRDISYEVNIGTRFRFSYNFDLEEPNEKKSIWITANKNSADSGAAAVIGRCNGALGSILQDESGISFLHYEPIICTNDLKTVGLYFNNVIITPQAQIMFIAQHNKFTQTYKINQRFVVGYDKVYKINAIHKFNSLTTYDPYDVGTILLYAELDQISEKDDFETRIAYNGTEASEVPEPGVVVENYTFKITKPVPIPAELYSEVINFEVALFNGDEKVNIPIKVDTILEGTDIPNSYFELSVIDENTFSLRRKKIYNRSALSIKCYIPADESPVGEEFKQTFEMSLRGLE